MTELWEVKGGSDEEGWIALRSPEGMFMAVVQGGGCTRLHINYLPGDFEDWAPNVSGEHIHICEVEDLIARLQDLVRIAKEQFKEDFWHDDD